MTDILGTGTSYNIEGNSGYFYEGLLFDKRVQSSSDFGPGNHYLMEVIDFDKTKVTNFKTVAIFSDKNVPLEKIGGDYYFVLIGKPRFGRINTSDDFPIT